MQPWRQPLPAYFPKCYSLPTCNPVPNHTSPFSGTYKNITSIVSCTERTDLRQQTWIHEKIESPSEINMNCCRRPSLNWNRTNILFLLIQFLRKHFFFSFLPWCIPSIARICFLYNYFYQLCKHYVTEMMFPILVTDPHEHEKWLYQRNQSFKL